MNGPDPTALRSVAEPDTRAAFPDLARPAGYEIECQRCGTVAVNQDFCACGEYLAWDNASETASPAPSFPIPAVADERPFVATVDRVLTDTIAREPASAPERIEAVLDGEPATSAPEPEPSYRPPAPAENIPTLLTLRDPARPDDSSGTAVTVSVLPGAEVTVLATVRNQGTIVDQFDLRVDGLPDSWWSLSPQAVFLNPWGSSGDYEQEVQVRLHPPRSSDSQARDWPVTITARSRALCRDVAAATATLTIDPYVDTVMVVGQERQRGRRHANFGVTVANRGNSPMEIEVLAQDTSARCPVTVTPERTTVPIGESAEMLLHVGAPYPLFFARPALHNITITHRAGDAGSGKQPE